MRLFALIDYHHLILALFLGFFTAFLIYLAFRHHSRPVPVILALLFVGVAVWGICYVVFFAIPGGPI